MTCNQLDHFDHLLPAPGYTLLASAPRVLHVDSDSDTALVLSTLLVPETVVTHAPTLAEALLALEHGQYALVVLDPDLPDGDGASLLQALDRMQAAPQVVLYSARMPAGGRSGHAYLPKPWTSPRQLWRTVSGLLGIGPLTVSEIPA
ncbi:response regulator [Oxalobacteraceae bacterium A2-2]